MRGSFRLKGWRAWALAGTVGLSAVFLFFSEFRQEDSLGQAPPLTLIDLEGRAVSLSDFSGRVVLLDFWATWCEPCQEELPDLIALHERYKNRGFSLVGVSMDASGAKAVAPYVRKNKIPYPVLLTEGEPPSGYHLPGLPTAFLIDASGRVARRFLGPKTYADLSKNVEELLAP